MIATNWKQHSHASGSGIFTQQTTIQQLKRQTTNVNNIDKSPEYHIEPDTTALCHSPYMKLIFRYTNGCLSWVLRRKLTAKRQEGKIKGNETIFFNSYCAEITKHISQISLNCRSKFRLIYCV